jgi:hypothetical protein
MTGSRDLDRVSQVDPIITKISVGLSITLWKSTSPALLLTKSLKLCGTSVDRI